MNPNDRDAISHLAVGVTAQHEAAQLAARLALDPKARAEYRADLDSVEVIARSAEASTKDFSNDRMARVKAQLLAAARAANDAPTVPAPAGYEAVVPLERLVDFGPGIKWAVLPGQDMTAVYWVFDPPACGDLPLETHINKQSGYVLNGDFTLLYKHRAAQPLHAGDHYTIEPGVLHGATFQSRTILCDVYQPPKDDFEMLYGEQLAASTHERQAKR